VCLVLVRDEWDDGVKGGARVSTSSEHFFSSSPRRKSSNLSSLSALAKIPIVAVVWFRLVWC
jgi:hypothetical protein